MKRIKHILIAAMVLATVAMFANANIPPTPVGLNNDTGNYWVNYTWSKDTDHPDNANVTDSFNVSMNKEWYNGTETFLNKDVGPGGWTNITVWAYNATGNGNMSVGNVSDNVQAPGAATELSHKCGYIPPPMDLSHLGGIPVKGIQTGDLPSSFDWRDSGNVTPVKDQSTCGTCWIFGTTSVLESAVLINEGAECNFSEQSVALCVDRSWTYLYDDANDPCDPGGWGWLAAEVFIKKGSVMESCNPYNTTALNCAGLCVCDDCAPVKRVDGYRLVTNDGLDLDAIKTAVYDHGPVTMSFNYTSTYESHDPTWGTIYDYYPSPESSNHLVSITGWDDSVPHQVPDNDGTGAWIVKNSWGTSWGDGGYFYLAYNSSCVTGIAYLEYKDPVPDEELLYWDEAGFVGSMGYGDSGAWMASNFTADQSGNLTHVDFWTTSNNAEYEIYVWNGYFGSELANQTGICQELGYYSIPLNAPIPIDAGQQFTVGVNITTPGYDYPLPIEFACICADPPIQTNVSFRRHESGDQWTDMADSDYNACLRARMVATFGCTCGDICANTSGWWRDGGAFNTSDTPIQAAVNAATAGETICVAADSYEENVNIGTSNLTLAGEGADVVNVTAASTSDHVFNVAADYVNISGFNVTGASSAAGIYLNGRQHCNISDNNASGNDYGIWLEYSSNNMLTSNTASGNDYGIYLYSSSNNTLANNTMSGNAYNFGVDGYSLPDYTQNIDMSNTVDGKPIYYWVDRQGGQIPTDAGYVGVVNSTNIIVRDLNLAKNLQGILFVNTSDSTIENVTTSDNDYCGIWLGHSSSDNTLTGNNASGNDCGIMLEGVGMAEGVGNNTTSNNFGRRSPVSSNNTLADNDASDKGCGIGLGEGVEMAEGASNNTLTSNTASNNEVGIVLLYDSNNNTLTGNNASGNYYGIWLEYSSNNTLTSNTASNNEVGIVLLYYSSNNTLTSNTASDNLCGIMLGAGMMMAGGVGNNTTSNNSGRRSPVSSDNTLADNDASDKGCGIGLGEGVEMAVGASNNMLTGNDASGNEVGIYLVYSSDNTLTSNTASGNGEVGIALLYYSSNNTLTSNTASNNWVGIYIIGESNNNTLTGNTASNNAAPGLPANGGPPGSGIWLEYSSNNTLTSNTASGNYYGIALGYSSNNTLTSNTASGNGEVGIVLLDYSSNNTLTGNTASGNSDWDIYIGNSPSNTFADNTLNGTTVSFTYSGDVSLRGVGLPAAGAPWYSIGKFINATNQSEDAWMILNFSYSNSDFTGDMDESNLTVWKYNGTWYKDGWNGTRYSDPANNTVGVNITSFSVFAPMTTGVPALDHITVEPGSALLNIDEPPKSQTFAATGRSKHTDPIPDLMFGRLNTDTSVGRLNKSTGAVVNFTAERVGRAYLTASNGSVTSDQAQVTVDAGVDTATVTDGAATVTSGDATVTCNFGDDVAGWINITAIGNATNSSDVNSSKPRYGLGDGDKGVSGVTVNVSEDILAAMANGSTIRIEICYNATTLAALGIDASTLAIWKYDNATKKWVKQPSTISGTCVYVDVSHLCPFGLFGSKAATPPTPSGGSSGGSGTYPPGWFGTPTTTVTATKAPAAPATGAATDAPPGKRVTPRPTKTKPAAAKAAAPAAEGTTAGTAKKGAPGFTAVFVIAGMLAVAYTMMRRRG